MICNGSPILIKSINVYRPAFMTKALGGVEKGEAKHILAATATANINGYGLTPIPIAACIAIGANNTAVAVLLTNIVSKDVQK